MTHLLSLSSLRRQTEHRLSTTPIDWKTSTPIPKRISIENILGLFPTDAEKSIRWEELPLTGAGGADTCQATGSTVILGDADGTTTMLGGDSSGGMKREDEPRSLKHRICKVRFFIFGFLS